MFSPAPRIPWRRERWETPDGDFIDLDWAEPTVTRDSSAPRPRLLALFHGLEGSSASPYARAIAAGALKLGWRCVVPHFRGCSGELNRLPRAYHSGDSEEIRWVLERLNATHAAGISLGGNALLKHLGEAGAATRIERAAAISAPLDLGAAARRLDTGLSRFFYTRHFLKSLKQKTLQKHSRDLIQVDLARLRAAGTFFEFDDTVTAPLHGFAGADDYWTRSSSGPYLRGIHVPTLVLNARNDPFMPEAALQRVSQAPDNVVLEFPRTGGHAGFPGRNRWLARRVLAHLSAT